MLKLQPAFLRRLVEQCDSVRTEEAARGQAAPSPRALDLAYALCVSTGTRDVRLALDTAHCLLRAVPESRPVARLAE